MRTRKKRAIKAQLHPVPEAIVGGTWTIQNGQPMVDLERQIMSVPTDDTEKAAFLRAHELTHVKITPPQPAYKLIEKYNISMAAMQSCEDLRVHTFLQQRGIESPVIAPASELVRALANIDDFKTIVCMRVSIAPCQEQTEEFEQALHECGKYTESELYDLNRLCRSVVDMFAVVRHKIAYDGSNPVNTQEGFEQLTVPVAQFLDSLFDSSDEIPAQTYGTYASPGDNEWGELEPIQRLQLSAVKRGKHGGQKLWREDGVIPVAPYRLTLDNKIFTRKRKLVGGTVLIDASGSMGFSDSDLVDLITVAPGAQVAVYAGEGTVGRLIIVADKGKMTNNAAIDDALIGEYHRMSGNVVDGPALQWLGKQPGPRFWVSDGMVTGKHDAMAHNLRHEAISIMRTNKIERINNWAELIECFG